MAKSIIVEVLNKLGHVSERYRSDHTAITIGRDYSNDVIISDAHVSPRHLTVSIDENQRLVVADLDSHNGSYLSDKRHVIKQDSVPSGATILLGKTKIRVVTDDHPVADTVRMINKHPMQKVWRHSRGWIMLAIAIGLSCVFEFFRTTTELETSVLLASAITTAILALVWAGSWAFTGRLLKHKAHFSYQLYITALIVCGTIVFAELPGLLEYNTHSVILAEIIDYIINTSLFGILLYVNIKLATHLGKKAASITAGTIAVACFATIGFLVYAQSHNFNANKQYSSTLYPPMLKITSSTEKQQFLENADRIFAD